jgi:hypothetical protein
MTSGTHRVNAGNRKGSPAAVQLSFWSVSELRENVPI